MVIERALALCDDVVVISYSKPEIPACGPERRASWLAARFPQARRLVVTDATLKAHRGASKFGSVPPNDADAEVHRHFVAFLCRCVLNVEIDAVFTSEEYGDGFAAILEAEQRRHNGGPSVTHVSVDPVRRLVPISASIIRAAVHANRQWLSCEVYASFVKRVCVLGGESSGKSTLAARLASALETVYVAEYGRELWERKGGVLAFDDLLHIGERQVSLEDDAAGRGREFLICDTSPLTTLFYSQHLFGRVAPALELLAAERRYDLTVLCAPDFGFVQDGTREDDALRCRQHAWYLDRLAARGDAWMLAEGTVERRVQAICARLRDG
jgi:NadR type nicotinamide-nucleotide adenylyltransferase